MVSVLMREKKCFFLQLSAAKKPEQRRRLIDFLSATLLKNVSGSGGGNGSAQVDAARGGATNTASGTGAYHIQQLLDAVVHLGAHALIDAGMFSI
jgi:hypothetical protein